MCYKRDLTDEEYEIASDENTTLPLQSNLTMSENNFFLEVSNLRENLSKIEKNAELIVKFLNENHSLNLTNNSSSMFNLDQLSITTRDLLKQTRFGIRSLNEETKQMKNPPIYRKQQESALAQRLFVAAETFKNAGEALSSKQRDVFLRQYRVGINPNASQSEVQQVLNNGSELFSNQILIGQRKEQNKSLLEVKKLNTEIQKIDRQVIELFELMIEMETIIDEKQNKLDIAEEYVDDSIKNTSKITDKVSAAIEHAKRIRERKWKKFLKNFMIDADQLSRLQSAFFESEKEAESKQFFDISKLHEWNPLQHKE
ncbi:hypothetical protein HK096_002810 [Nowakowskiella sp. JEL0078]|nr:hypothetical protein HK096_002810 [Nowakowskiella sp. JEL0078]